MAGPDHDHANADRRRRGVEHVTISDGNGGTVSVISVRMKTIHAIAASLAAMATIAVIVAGAARAGVESAVRDEIERQIAETSSPINRQINAKFENACAYQRDETRRQITAVQESVAESVSEVKTETATLRATQSAIRDDVAEIRDDVKELLRQRNGNR